MIDLGGDSRYRRPPAPRTRRHAVPVLAAAAVLAAGSGIWALRSVHQQPRSQAQSQSQSQTQTHGQSQAQGQGLASPAGQAGQTAAPAGDGRAAAATFLAAWQAGDYARMQSLVAGPGDDLARAYGGLAQRLHLTSVRVTPGSYTGDGVSGRLTFHVALALDGLGEVGYDNVVNVARTAGPAVPDWRVVFTSGTVHPALQLGQRLDLVAATSARAVVTDRTGQPLTGDGDLMANLVGAVGPDGRGASGLQRLLDGPLTGQGGKALAIVDVTTGARVSVIKEWPGTAGQPVRTSIDLAMQRAAERALASVTGTAALVAIDGPTGEVRALVNRPTSGIPASINGIYAPGSTFKVITATAALMAGMTPSTMLSCPATVAVGGRTIRNSEGHLTAPAMSLTQAFATSCNTAFAGLSTQLPASALHDAAALYGFDAGAPLPIASQGGNAPAPASPEEGALDAIGQGRVEASPLQMASVAAAVQSGTWRQPHVLTCTTCAAHPIGVAASLRPLMRAVVTSGTGTGAAGVPGGPVYGKTGTAEYGTGSPPATHAWFIGWQGRTAFAVFVHDGSSGAAAAVPVAARFLRALAVG